MIRSVSSAMRSRVPGRSGCGARSGQLRDLLAQGCAVQVARAAQARARAERAQAAEVAVADTRVDTGVIERVAEALQGDERSSPVPVSSLQHRVCWAPEPEAENDVGGAPSSGM